MKLRTESGKESFYQWDTNQRLIVEEADTCHQVHFWHSADENALVCNIREEEGKRIADVPNILLQSDMTIYAYLISNNGGGVATKHAFSFKVLPRPKPEDYVYTQTEVQTFEALEERITALEENGGSSGGTIKTVNGVGPDENGNVEIAISDSEVEIPEALPNPNALTFTGAVEATYDGTQAVEVEIPSGGNEASWRLLAEIDFTNEENQAASFEWTGLGGVTEVWLLVNGVTNASTQYETYWNLHVNGNANIGARILKIPKSGTALCYAWSRLCFDGLIWLVERGNHTSSGNSDPTNTTTKTYTVSPFVEKAETLKLVNSDSSRPGITGNLQIWVR